MKKTMSILAISISLLSCNNFYKAITITKPGAGKIAENLTLANRYFILRNGNQAYAMSNVSFTADSQFIQCNLASLPDEHKLHLTNGRKGKMIYAKAGIDDEAIPLLNEVHYYITPDVTAIPGIYNISLSQLQKIEVLEKDKKRTAKNHAISGLLITCGTVLVVAIVTAMSLVGGIGF